MTIGFPLGLTIGIVLGMGLSMVLLLGCMWFTASVRNGAEAAAQQPRAGLSTIGGAPVPKEVAVNRLANMPGVVDKRGPAPCANDSGMSCEPLNSTKPPLSVSEAAGLRPKVAAT